MRHGYSLNGEKIYVTNNGSIKFDTAFSISFGFMLNNNRVETYISMVDPTTGNGPSFIIGTTLPAVPNMMDMGINDVSKGCSSSGYIDNKSIVDTINWQPVPGSWYNAIGIYH